VVSRGAAVGAVAGAGFNLLHPSPHSAMPEVDVGSVSLRGAVLHWAGISLIFERSQNVRSGLSRWLLGLATQALLAGFGFFLLYFMVKLDQIYVVHVSQCSRARSDAAWLSPSVRLAPSSLAST
jgi:ABC-type Fe3+-siderophore transport system permease subunit